MNPKVPASAAVLLDFIAQPESKGNYNAYFRHELNSEPKGKTIGQILTFQDFLVKSLHMPSSAYGRYQFMPTTLREIMGRLKLAPSAPFTPDDQDWYAYDLLRLRGFDPWTNGHLADETFADNLSKEWASLPYSNGRSYYDKGKNSLNRSLVSRASLMTCLKRAKSMGKEKTSPPPISTIAAPSQKDNTVNTNANTNPLSAIISFVQIATTFAPTVPHLVSDVGALVKDGSKLITDLRILDMNATLRDVQKVFEGVRTTVADFEAAANAVNPNVNSAGLRVSASDFARS